MAFDNGRSRFENFRREDFGRKLRKIGPSVIPSGQNPEGRGPIARKYDHRPDFKQAAPENGLAKGL